MSLFQFKDIKVMRSSVRTEALAGLTSFLATMYIIIVNPNILKQGGLPFEATLTATVLISFISTLSMGLFARNPIVLAPGMGINAFFTFTVIQHMKVPWQQALGAVFWSGVVALLLSFLNVRVSIVKAIPRSIRYGVAAGIGVFISLIGFINAGFVKSNPATVIGRGDLNLQTITFLCGLFITGFLMIRRVRGSFILGIVLTTFILKVGEFLHTPGSPSFLKSLNLPEKLISWPDFSLFLKADLLGSLQWGLLPIIFAFAFTDLFDSISTFIGVAEAGDLLDEEGEPLHLKRSLIVDAMATALSGLVGTSSATSYIESAAGIEEGGKTGLTAVVAAFLFLPFLFFSPLLSMVPALATSPILVLVGLCMTRTLFKLDQMPAEEWIPALLAFILIPLTFSITQGIIWAFLSWTFFKVAQGKMSKVPFALWFIDLFCLWALVVSP